MSRGITKLGLIGSSGGVPLSLDPILSYKEMCAKAILVMDPMPSLLEKSDLNSETDMIIGMICSPKK